MGSLGAGPSALLPPGVLIANIFECLLNACRSITRVVCVIWFSSHNRRIRYCYYNHFQSTDEDTEAQRAHKSKLWSLDLNEGRLCPEPGLASLLPGWQEIRES